MPYILLFTPTRRTANDHEIMNTVELKFRSAQARQNARDYIERRYNAEGFWCTFVEYCSE